MRVGDEVTYYGKKYRVTNVDGPIMTIARTRVKELTVGLLLGFIAGIVFVVFVGSLMLLIWG